MQQSDFHKTIYKHAKFMINAKMLPLKHNNVSIQYTGRLHIDLFIHYEKKMYTVFTVNYELTRDQPYDHTAALPQAPETCTMAFPAVKWHLG